MAYATCPNQNCGYQNVQTRAACAACGSPLPGGGATRTGGTPSPNAPAAGWWTALSSGRVRIRGRVDQVKTTRIEVPPDWGGSAAEVLAVVAAVVIAGAILVQVFAAALPWLIGLLLMGVAFKSMMGG